jgi:Domain of unknown function (DUF4157)
MRASCSCAAKEGESTKLRRAPAATIAHTPVSLRVADVITSQGRPLDTTTRASMERGFDHDFARVRIHADDSAAKSAARLNARAFTVGPHIVFGRGEFAPTTSSGRRLLAHELAHVVEQGASIASPGASLEIGAEDDPAESRADRAASALLHGKRANPTFHTAPIQLRRAPLPTTTGTVPAYAQGKVEPSAYAAWSAAQRNVLYRVYQALHSARYWDDVMTIAWVNVTFNQLDVTFTPGFLSRLAEDGGFCLDDHPISNSQHRDKNTYRQVTLVATPGLHIGIPKRPGTHGFVHLDSYSPVSGRKEDGRCRIPLGHGLKHALIDLGHVNPRNLPEAPEPGSLSWDSEPAQRNRGM